LGWVEHYFIDPSVLADLKEVLPCLASVGGFEKPSVPPRREERSLSGHINHVGIPGIEGDHADVLGILETDLGPGRAGVR